MVKRILSVLFVTLSCFFAGCGGDGGGRRSEVDLLVGSSANGQILRFDPYSGRYLGIFASGSPLQSPEGMDTLGNNDVVVGDFVTHHVYRYSSNGTFKQDLGMLPGTPYGLLAIGPNTFLVSVFDSPDPTSGKPTGEILQYTPTAGFQTFAQGGSLNGPDGLTIGPDGLLYVSSQHSAQILRYDLYSGAFLGAFASGSPLGPPNAGPSGLIFGPDNNLYVTQHDTNPTATTGGMVIEYNGMTGAFISQVVPVGAGGLSGPVGILFSPQNNLLVTSAATNNVLAYTIAGKPLSPFAASPNLVGPIYMTYATRFF